VCWDGKNSEQRHIRFASHRAFVALADLATSVKFAMKPDALRVELTEAIDAVKVARAAEAVRAVVYSTD
jgi:hypothetical protein